MDNKLKALHELYNYAVSHNLCANKKEFAELVGVANSNLSKAFGSDEKYLTDKFITRVNTALGDIFNPAWLLYGEGDMLCSGNTQSADNASAPVCQNNGNNVTQNAGAPSATIDALIEEMKAQRISHEKLQEASNTQIDRLLSIIEKITNK